MNSVRFVWQRKQSRAKGCNTEQTDDASVSHVMFNRHRFHSSAVWILHFVRCLLPPLISLLISSSSPLRVDKVRPFSCFFLPAIMIVLFTLISFTCLQFNSFCVFTVLFLCFCQIVAFCLDCFIFILQIWSPPFLPQYMPLQWLCYTFPYFI